MPTSGPALHRDSARPARGAGWALDQDAVVPDRCAIVIDVLEHKKRPVSVAADHQEVRDVVRVAVKMDVRQRALILFDREHSWDERVLAEQFRT